MLHPGNAGLAGGVVSRLKAIVQGSASLPQFVKLQAFSKFSLLSLEPRVLLASSMQMIGSCGPAFVVDEPMKVRQPS